MFPPEPRADGRSRLGRYELLSRLASGGMGNVYLARLRDTPGITRLVALKTIRPSLADDRRFVRMFVDEARIAARIQHPNVCSVFDYGEANGAWFIVMEHLRGAPLSELLERIRGAPPGLSALLPAMAAHVIAEAAEGLHAAHELTDEEGRPLGVVHRDVSPQNIFVGFDGSVRVIDFGVASALDRLQRTETGELKGKLAYAAPEQIRGGHMDRRTDVWALGAVLFECLAQRPPRTGREVSRLLEERVPSLCDAAPGCPLALDEAVSKALARQRDRRHPTARELGRELRAWLAEEGLLFDAAELSELMERAFPGERDRQLASIRAATRPENRPEDEPAALPASSGERDPRPARSARPPGKSVRKATLLFLGLFLGAMILTLWLLR
jgi:serine/threonine-protein kinase